MPRATVISVLVLLIAAPILPRVAAAALTGNVFHFDGSRVADAPIRVRGEAAGLDLRTRSAADGRYAFPDLPPGSYVVTVNMPCCLFLPYINDAVEVPPDGAAGLDIELGAFNIAVEGDNPADVTAELLRQQQIPDLPVPRMSDGRPDLSGVWLPTDDPFPEDPKPLEWVGEVVQQRVATFFLDHPSARCLPGSPPVPGGAAFVSRFVQRPEFLAILFEDVPGFRQVFLDGRALPANPNPTWMGHSVGRWEGDTLVVHTAGFNDRGWTDIYPRTTQLRMRERYTRTSYGELEVDVTYDDPGVFVEPWSRHMVWQLAPQIDVMEYVCENNAWIDTSAADVGLEPGAQGESP